MLIVIDRLNEGTRSVATCRVDSGCLFCLGLVIDSGCFIASGVKRYLLRLRGGMWAEL